MIEIIPLDKLKPDPNNVRRDVGDVADLAASIRSIGLIQPIVATRGDDGTYTVLAGHRRLAAAEQAGLTELEVLVRDGVDDERRVEAQLVENLRREGLRPLEEAVGYSRLVALGVSQRQIAEKVGCSQPHVSKRLSLLELPNEARTALDAGGITVEQALEFAKVKDRPELIKRGLAAVVDDQQYGGSWDARDLHDWIERELADEQLKERVAARVAELAAKGIWVLEKRPGYSERKSRQLGQYDLNVDKRKHAAEPCHAVFVGGNTWSDKLVEETWCTDVGRHDAKGASTLKAKNPTRSSATTSPAERAKAKEERDAAKARRACVVKFLAKPSDTIVDLALANYLADANSMEAKAIGQLLGLPEPPKPKHSWERPDWTAAVLAFAVENREHLLRVVGAFVAVQGEDNIRTRTDFLGYRSRYEQLLTAAGYKAGA